MRARVFTIEFGDVENLGGWLKPWPGLESCNIFIFRSLSNMEDPSRASPVQKHQPISPDGSLVRGTTETDPNI